MPEESIYESLLRRGMSRREFFKYCGYAAATIAVVGTPLGKAAEAFAAEPVDTVARALQATPRVPVIWLEHQNCTGCVESFVRSASPSATSLLLDSISLDYSDTLMAAAGTQAEGNMTATMTKYTGKYLVICDGSLPTANAGYCTVGGKSTTATLQTAAAKALGVIAAGTCASFGGLPAALPNPTKAVPVSKIVTGKPVVNVSGCPPVPEVLAGAILNYVVFGAPPELDDLKRPKLYYEKELHEGCPRRVFFEAKQFALAFDDAGARKGWCLLKLGCRGPQAFNSCARKGWKEGLSFPIASGHPCLGCTEPAFWDTPGGFSTPISV